MGRRAQRDGGGMVMISTTYRSSSISIRSPDCFPGDFSVSAPKESVLRTFIRHFITRSSATLFSHVSHILKLGTLKKMVCTNTGGIIAVVTDQFIRINRTMSHFVGNTMSQCTLAIDLESSVAVAIQATNPKPTTFSLINFIPKSFHNSPMLADHRLNVNENNLLQRTHGKF